VLQNQFLIAKPCASVTPSGFCVVSHGISINLSTLRD